MEFQSQLDLGLASLPRSVREKYESERHRNRTTYPPRVCWALLNAVSASRFHSRCEIADTIQRTVRTAL